MGLSWFKHYNTASQGLTLRLLWDAHDYEAYGLWWQLLEMISRWEKEETRGLLTLSWAVLARETNWKPSKCRRVLSRIVSVSKIDMKELPDGYFSFLLPNWLELQETRGGKRIAKTEQKPGRSKKEEVRSEILETDSKISIRTNVVKLDIFTKEQLEVCKKEWKDTLKHYSIEKNVDMDQMIITRLLQIHGFDKTLLAIKGSAKEERSDKYDPSKNVSIQRFLKPNVFDKFVNLGAQVKKKSWSEEMLEKETAELAKKSEDQINATQ